MEDVVHFSNDREKKVMKKQKGHTRESANPRTHCNMRRNLKSD
jgi:hypothetical protein